MYSREIVERVRFAGVWLVASSFLQFWMIGPILEGFLSDMSANEATVGVCIAVAFVVLAIVEFFLAIHFLVFGSSVTQTELVVGERCMATTFIIAIALAFMCWWQTAQR